MSDVWPPPPENQPNRTASAPSLRRSLAPIISSGLLYSCLGATLLLLALAILVLRASASFRWLNDFPVILSGLVIFGPTLLIVGGGCGYATKRTTRGLMALAVSVCALTALGCFGIWVVGVWLRTNTTTVL